MNKQIKIGISLVVIGELLYFIQSYLSKNYTNLNDFISGLILGLSIGINLIGIIILIISTTKKENK